MRAIPLFTVLGMLGVGFFLAFGLEPGDADDNADGIEVLAHGPVHQAFAEPVTLQPEPTAVIAKQPPEPVNELPAERKPEDENAVWIPGYWAWDDGSEGFLWVSGIWRVPAPGRHWVPGYWNQVNDGWQWAPGYWAPTTEETVELSPQPPEPIAEATPPQPEGDTTFVPGCWVVAEKRWAWRAGHWIRLRPGWVWCHASYVWTPAGYVFVDGYWDYELPRRGFLCAPVSIAARVYGRAGFVYQPRYVIGSDFLVQALFVQPSRHQYFFGDYFEPRYAKLGYRPWVDYRVAGRYPDPLLAYDRWQHREQPRWEDELRAKYQARTAGKLAAPPRTLAEQQRLQKAKKATVNVVVSVKNFQSTSFKLQAVPKARLEEIHKTTTKEIHALRDTRKKAEAKVRAGHVEEKKGAPPTLVKIELTKPKTAFKAHETIKPPPPPPHPKAKAKQPKGEKKPQDKQPPKDKGGPSDKAPPKDKGEKQPPKDKGGPSDKAPPKDKESIDKPPPKDKLKPADKSPKDKPARDKDKKKDRPPPAAQVTAFVMSRDVEKHKDDRKAEVWRRERQFTEFTAGAILAAASAGRT